MKSFNISLENCICADIGASTGGFTDCMLQDGAKKVYSIDVGYGQLAWKLRTDERVINLERTNFRYVTREQVPDELDFASVDVSFISLYHILPNLRTLLKEGGHGGEAINLLVKDVGAVVGVGHHIGLAEGQLGIAGVQFFNVGLGAVAHQTHDVDAGVVGGMLGDGAAKGVIGAGLTTGDEAHLGLGAAAGKQA